MQPSSQKFMDRRTIHYLKKSLLIHNNNNNALLLQTYWMLLNNEIYRTGRAAKQKMTDDLSTAL